MKVGVKQKTCYIVNAGICKAYRSISLPISQYTAVLCLAAIYKYQDNACFNEDCRGHSEYENHPAWKYGYTNSQ